MTGDEIFGRGRTRMRNQEPLNQKPENWRTEGQSAICNLQFAIVRRKLMARRSIFAFILATLAMLALAVPALAGGWAVLTLDSLPREVRAGTSIQLGFVVRQHGKTPTNKDLDGNPLK